MSKLYTALSVLTLACIGLLATTRIVDPDTMQYLASGRAMLQHGLDYGCVFNYTGAPCQFAYPQWMFHLATYAAYRVGAWNALVALQVAIAVAVFAVIWVEARRKSVHPLVTATLLLLTAMVARERFLLRADFFALLPAVLLYCALDRHFDASTTSRSRRMMLPALAAIQIVWANTHGSFYIAFVLLGAFVAQSVLARTPGVRQVLEATGVVVLASLLNPFGLKSFLQPLRFMLGGSETAPQLEFVSPFAPADLTHSTVIAYKVLLVVLVALLVLSFRVLKARDVLILAPLIYLSAKGMRHIAMLAVLCGVILPPYAEDVRARVGRWVLRKGGQRRGTMAAFGVAALLFATVLGIGFGASTDRLYRFDAISRRTGWGVSDLVYPAAAVDFVLRNDLPGNVFNDYSIGTYLNWRLFPARKTFIDGHTYTSQRLAYYRQVMAGGVPHQQVADTYDINTFFLSHKSAEARALMQRLHRDSGWALVYLDEIAAIFLRRVPGNEALIARFSFVPAAELVNVKAPADFYLGHTDRGLALSILGFDAEALAELERASRENPRSFVTLTALGILRDARGDSAGARDAYLRSVRVRPGYAPGHFWLGVWYLRQKQVEEGIGQLETALRINRAFPLAHYNLGAAFENRGDKRRAREHYRQELEINPSYQPAQKALRRVG